MLYKLSQPSADFDELLKLSKLGKEDTNNPFYEQHYLSNENYTTILEMFIDAYCIRNPWRENCDTIIDYLVLGGTKDKYIPASGSSPGYRGYEHTPKLEKLIGQDNKDKTIDLINSCKEFYKRNGDEDFFRFNMMNYGPTSNKSKVIEYWKSQNKPIKIKDFNIDDLL